MMGKGCVKCYGWIENKVQVLFGQGGELQQSLISKVTRNTVDTIDKWYKSY